MRCTEVIRPIFQMIFNSRYQSSILTGIATAHWGFPVSDDSFFRLISQIKLFQPELSSHTLFTRYLDRIHACEAAKT